MWCSVTVRIRESCSDLLQLKGVLKLCCSCCLLLCRLMSVTDNGVALVLVKQAACVLRTCSFPGEVFRNW